jgi:hypothetical protein
VATETSTIKVIADTAQAERALGSLHSQLAGIGKVVVATAIVHQFTKIAEGIDAINKSAQKFGISSAAMDALGQSAQLAGIDFGELTAGLQKFQQNLGDALIKNTGPAAAGLAMLGLKAGELANLPINEQLLKIKDSLSGIENPALKAAIAVDILGKQGAKLLKAADEAQRLEQRFKNLGLALSDVDTQGVENALDRVTEVIQVVEQGFKKLVANIAPYVDAAAQAILFIVDNFGGPIVTALGMATRALIAFLAVLVVGKTVAVIQGMVTGFQKLRTAIIAAEGAAAALNVVLKTNPLIRVAQIVATIAAVFGGPLLEAASKLLGVEEETTKQVEERKKAAEGDVEAAARALRIKQLVLDIEENIVPQIQEQVRLMEVKNNLGDVAYETEKLIGEQAKKYNISLEEARKLVEGRVSSLNAELALQNKINEAVKSGMGEIENPSGYDLSGARKAEKDLALTRKTANQEATLGNEMRLVKEIGAYASKLDQEYALRLEYGTKVSTLDDYEAMLRRNNYAEESDEYKALLYAKETAFSQHIQKLVELDRQRFEQSKFMELQNQQYSQFGYDTKKAMAKEAADFEMKSDTEKAQWAMEQTASVFSALGAQNKKAFEASKALNIAMAIMNTYMAATKALATYPWPFGMIAAVGAVAAGMVQVAQIRSQSYSGRALGGPVMGGNPYIVGENGPELFTPNTTGSITRNSDLQGSGITNINFNIQANDSQGFDDLLVQRRGMITQFVKDAMTEQGQRSKM